MRSFVCELEQRFLELEDEHRRSLELLHKISFLKIDDIINTVPRKSKSYEIAWTREHMIEPVSMEGYFIPTEQRLKALGMSGRLCSTATESPLASK